ncbi:MAG TPA: Hsp20/alpha crystallin family protein [Dehalococcoidia bacterium]|jgi:HSP20 family protein|nr:heat-shock protein Hsp20 [Chloroflexota bacterium]MDP5876692.1 Hsp20/alpha crystallin family protein [Dehalococcoidia bacterium]MDP6272425.1 Hsp20/alpha crystallin family protein [Dehalococcoidia bacterium]MDP7160795.1 Hsp20/alpha crystallin family protein [Dehalococcoidia bacterium]MDP7213276.1 Hsp20/alpha crystallin family protein [Dehalococcoidia bacterium]|tara:strand:+ start:847 stop:1320 length:474 start_codon:yes stop_codon:yes gene_type:complete
MTLQTWRPFAELRRNNNFNTRFGFPFVGTRPAVSRPPGGAWRIPLDVVDQGGDLVITASVPGVDPADIKATIDDGVLAIRADMPDAPAATESKPETEYAESEYLRRERRTGSFSRAIQLPDTVDPEKVTSKYANGVLTVTLPKSEATKVREITVKVA